MDEGAEVVIREEEALADVAEPAVPEVTVKETPQAGRLSAEQRKDFESKGCVVVALPTVPESNQEIFRINARGILLEHVGGLATDEEIDRMVEEWPSGFDIVVPPDQITGVNFEVDTEKDPLNVNKLIKSRQEILNKYPGMEMTKETLPLLLAISKEVKTKKLNDPLSNGIIRTTTQRIREKQGILSKCDYVLINGQNVDWVDSSVKDENIIAIPLLVPNSLS